MKKKEVNVTVPFEFRRFLDELPPEIVTVKYLEGRYVIETDKYRFFILTNEKN